MEHAHWTPPDRWRCITAVDSHTAGEPFRVITGGFPDIQGETMLARRRYARQHFDELRTALMWEPRGHADMYGGIVTPPVSLRSDLGILFIHNEGFSTMCGHGIIALVTVAIETGMVPIPWGDSAMRVDTPAGLVIAYPRLDGTRVRSVAFHNVPSFVVALDETVDVPGLGEVRYDLAFGGAFYAYVDGESVGLGCRREEYWAIIDKGRKIKQAVAASREIVHPFEKDLGFLYGVIFTGPPQSAEADARNVCVFANGEVDRSPTGTGVSGLLAVRYARGELEIDQAITVESLIGSRFLGRAVDPTAYGPFPAVIPEVEGRAHVTGRHEFLLDPSDELRHGFLLR